MIQIAPNSFLIPFDPSTPQPGAATAEKAQELLDQFNADQAAGKFDETDISFDGYQEYLQKVIRTGGTHPAFPPYPKYKA